MPAGLEQLSVMRIQRAMNALQDVRNMPAELKFLNRTPLVPALDNEIMARFIGRPVIADLVADDGVAGTYTLGKFQTYTSEPVNIKMGVKFTQAQINEIANFGANSEDGGLVDEMITMQVEASRIGVMQRMELLLVSMALDSFTYARLGLNMTGVTWGVPSDLKVTPSVAWQGNAGTATPIDDILTVKLIAATRYGVDYDRVTMSTAAFRAMIATTEFQNKAKVQLRSDIGYTNLSLNNLDQQRNFAETVLGMRIEFYDARYWSQAGAGTNASAPYWPLNMVMLSSTANDNNPMVQDFANGITTESRVMRAFGGGANTPNPGGVIGSFAGAQRGPVGYATLEGMNPPNVTMWAVARGFPRKHLLQANATLNVGTITDPVSVSEPF